MLRSGDDLEIKKIGVMAAFRRQGIARRLFAQALAGADAGVQRGLLDVSSANETAIRFYEQLGFRELLRRKKYYRDGSDALVMARDIK